MAVTVTQDQILDGMVAQLSALKPAVGSPLSTTQYVRSIGRYTGAASIAQLLEDGAAGRTPALQVGFISERTVKTTIGRRLDKVEGTFAVYVISDKRTSRDARSIVQRLCDDVRQTLGARRLGLVIRPMRWVFESLFQDSETAIVMQVQFTTTYRIDYTKAAGPFDEMDTVAGRVQFPDADDGTPGALRGEVDVIFP